MDLITNLEQALTTNEESLPVLCATSLPQLRECISRLRSGNNETLTPEAVSVIWALSIEVPRRCTDVVTVIETCSVLQCLACELYNSQQLKDENRLIRMCYKCAFQCKELNQFSDSIYYLKLIENLNLNFEINFNFSILFSFNLFELNQFQNSLNYLDRARNILTSRQNIPGEFFNWSNLPQECFRQGQSLIERGMYNEAIEFLTLARTCLNPESGCMQIDSLNGENIEKSRVHILLNLIKCYKQIGDDLTAQRLIEEEIGGGINNSENLDSLIFEKIKINNFNNLDNIKNINLILKIIHEFINSNQTSKLSDFLGTLSGMNSTLHALSILDKNDSIFILIYNYSIQLFKSCEYSSVIDLLTAVAHLIPSTSLQIQALQLTAVACMESNQLSQGRVLITQCLALDGGNINSVSIALLIGIRLGDEISIRSGFRKLSELKIEIIKFINYIFKYLNEGITSPPLLVQVPP
jgi:tetratricopeptide (TPR) repeat protein